MSFILVIGVFLVRGFFRSRAFFLKYQEFQRVREVVFGGSEHWRHDFRMSRLRILHADDSWPHRAVALLPISLHNSLCPGGDP